MTRHRQGGQRPDHAVSPLGGYLSSARIKRGLSQQELAGRCGLTQGYVSLLERGSRLPALSQLVRFAEVLHVPLQWFLNGACRQGEDWPDLALELYDLGVVDLLVADAVVPGAFRPPEQVLALVLSGDRLAPRVVEALPAVLAWNDWNPKLLAAYAETYDPRVSYRVAWLADVAETIHRDHGFPGGCRNPRQLAALRRGGTRPETPDDLGYAPELHVLPPVSKRWNITYAATLGTFRERAERLHQLRAPRRRRVAQGRT